MEFKYTVTKELLRILLSIGVLEEKLKSLSLPTSLRMTLLQGNKIRTSYFSNKIEGNCLTLKQSEEVWKGNPVHAPSRDIQEVKNLFDLFDFMIGKSGNEKACTIKLICEIHKYVERNIVKGKLLGNFRESQNAIFDSATRQVVYMPPEAKEIPFLMKQLIEKLNTQNWEHDLIKVAIAHFGLVTIHPFMDGNGRTARALSTLLLMRSDFYFVKYMAWDEYFYKYRSKYYEILHHAQGDNYYQNQGVWDVQHWLEYFILGIEQTVLHFLKELQTPQNKAILNRRQEKALRYLHRKMKITNREYCHLNKVSNFTARADLLIMEEDELIERIGKGRSVEYVLKKI